MKNLTTLLLAISLFYSFSSIAQTQGLYFTEITTISTIPKKVYSGYLYEVTDSSIVLANIDSKARKIVQKKMDDGGVQIISFRYANIEKISCKRLNRGRGLKFFLGGLTATTILLFTIYKPDFGGLSLFGGNNYNYTPHSDNSTIIVAPVLLSIPLGVLSGSIPNKSENIYGDYTNFQKIKSDLKNISYVQMYKN